MGIMDDMADKAAKETDEELSAQEASMLKETGVNLEGLRPQVSDKASFDKLIEAVNAATANNESVAQLQNRLKTLGAGVVKVAKEVVDIIK